MSVNHSNAPGEDRERPHDLAGEADLEGRQTLDESERHNDQPIEENVGGDGEADREDSQNAALVDYAEREAELFHTPDDEDYATVEVDDLTQTEQLLRYAEEQAELFHDPDGLAYATVRLDDHRETYSIKSERFKDWLLMLYYRAHGKAPKTGAVTDALATIRAQAVFDGPEIPVFVRVAEHEGDIYVDLGGDRWEAVRISREGWSVEADLPVRFIRKAGSAPLPFPQGGGSVEELRFFLNVGGEGDFRLVLAWVAFSLSPWGPYPILVLQGEQGSAKSTTVRVLRALVDPAVEPLRALPKSERDLAIAAGNAWVLAFDNLSGIPDVLSDALCRLATGGGFATRMLYTDDEETIFSAKRPIILNGIDDIATRGDLQERSLLVSLPSIPEEKRREENAFWAEFEAARPGIFGALLGAMSAALRGAEDVRLERKPRMADFAVRATAMESYFGWEPGSFVEVYAGNRQEASEALLANEPVIDAIRSLLSLQGARGKETWSGTATELLSTLSNFVDDDIKRSRAWPRGPQILSRKLRRLAPALRAVSIEYSENEEGREKRKIKTLRKVGPPGTSYEHSAPQDGAEVGAGFASDGTVDEPEGEDYAGKLAELGWHRDERPLVSPPEALSEGSINPNEDPVARALRHRVPIHYGYQSSNYNVPISGPQVFTAEETLDWEVPDKTEGELRSCGWPATLEEMATYLRRVISLLQEQPYPFYDPRTVHFYYWEFERKFEEWDDPEKFCREALLHAEVWRNEETSEELWALIALQPGWSPPREELEYTVWVHVVNQNTTTDPEIEISDDEEGHFRF